MTYMATTISQQAAEVQYAPTTEERKTQYERILQHIDTFGSITPWGAIHSFGCTKLATRIGELERRSGHKFTRTPEVFLTRLGHKTRIVKYSFAKGLTANDYRGRA